MRSLVAASVLLSSIAISAQQTPAPLEILSPQSRAALQRLERLDHFTPVTWEWHDGDLAHGEDPASKEGWMPWHGRLQYGPGAIWIRGSVHVPESVHGYALGGASLMFALHPFPRGTTAEILYLNGRRIAMGSDLEPEMLANHLETGEVIHVAVKLLATSEAKSIPEPQLTLLFAVDRPDPDVFSAECASAASLLPTLDENQQLREADETVIENALATIDLSALDRSDQPSFDASLRQAEATLAPLREKLRGLTIDAVGNSHIDAAWRWPVSDTMDVVRRTFSTALQLMTEYPNFTFTQPDAQYDDWMERQHPEIFHEMQRRANEGRWQPIGGMWAEPDLNLPDGETMVRELLLGKRYMQSRFGKDVRIGWNVDSFGYSWQLPQVYKKSGVDFFVTQKMSWNEENQLPLKLFWWQSPDGSSVLTYFPKGYGGSTNPIQMASEAANARRLAPGLDEVMHLYGVSDHGGGPTRMELDEAERWINGAHVYPKLTLGTPEQFFAHVASQVTPPSASPVWNYRTLAADETSLAPASDGRIAVPVWRDELYLETHLGTYTTQAHQKQNMRDSEEWMLDAEKLSSIAWAQGGAVYPQSSLNEAWKKVLFNTNHDLAAGSGIGEIYKEAQAGYDTVHATTADASNAALAWIAERADTRVADPRREVPLLVMNTLAWARDGFVTAEVQLPSRSSSGLSVRDARGKIVPSQVIARDADTGRSRLLLKVTNVPSLGFEVLRVSPARTPASTDLKGHGTTMENALLRVVVDPANGCIRHLITKSDGYDFIADGGCGNQLQTFTDLPKRFDAWNIDPEALQTMKPLEETDSVTIGDRGPLRSSIVIRRHWGRSTFQQTIVLYAGADRVDIENQFDWHETHILLKAAMPLRASSATAAFEIPYGVIDRPATRNNSVEQAKFEVPALRWADLGDGKHGLSLINNSKYGYDATAHSLRLSLLRSPVYPDPDADRGIQRFAYSLYPHAGSWQSAMTERRGYEFNYKLEAMQVPPHEGSLGREHSFVQVNDPNIILTALKKSEDGDALILRAYDWSGHTTDATITVPGSPQSASEADMMEHATGPLLPLSGNTIHVPMHPFEINTIRVTYDKLARH